MGSQRESKSMRGCFLLLLHTCAVYGSAFEHVLAQPALDCSNGYGDCQDVVSVPFNLTALTGAAGVGDLPGSSSNSIGVSLPEPCPAFHCQQRSRRNRNKMICCLLTTRRFKCPNSC